MLHSVHALSTNIITVLFNAVSAVTYYIVLDMYWHYDNPHRCAAAAATLFNYTSLVRVIVRYWIALNGLHCDIALVGLYTAHWGCRKAKPIPQKTNNDELSSVNSIYCFTCLVSGFQFSFVYSYITVVIFVFLLYTLYCAALLAK